MKVWKDASHLRKSGSGLVELDIGTLQAWLFSEGGDEGGSKKSALSILLPPLTVAETKQQPQEIQLVHVANKDSTAVETPQVNTAVGEKEKDTNSKELESHKGSRGCRGGWRNFSSRMDPSGRLIVSCCFSRVLLKGYT